MHLLNATLLKLSFGPNLVQKTNASIIYEISRMLFSSKDFSDCNWTRTQNHLFLKRTLNHLNKLAKLLSCVLSTYLYGAFECGFTLKRVRDMSRILTLYILKFQFCSFWNSRKFRINLGKITKWSISHANFILCIKRCLLQVWALFFCSFCVWLKFWTNLGKNYRMVH